MTIKYEVDCTNVASFDDFIAQFNKAFPAELGVNWHGNLDAFNDYLSWPDSPYELRIRGAEVLKKALGYEATLNRLNAILLTCHPSNVAEVESRIANARNQTGETLYDEILEIISNNEQFLRVYLE